MKDNTRIVALKEKNNQDIKVLIIAEDHRQRMAFSDTIHSCGFSLVGCLSRVQLQEKPELSDVAIDIWLIDSDYDDNVATATTASKSSTVLVGFSQAPYLNEAQQYAKWQRKLKRKLAQMLDLPMLIDSPADNSDNMDTDWRYVVFLGASMGGPSAVKEFLDNLPTTLPVCILLAHHFNQTMIGTLPRILNRQNNWRCQVITSSQRLRAGQCLIAPVDKQIVCDSTGRVILLDQAWDGEYKPAIGKILKNTSDVYGSELINIIFSGMGNDGSQYLDLIQDNNSQLWAQQPSLSTCPSQPQAIIDSGYCSFVGSPAELAKKLMDYIDERAATASLH
ncbi:chemotaxis protein CheB [Psychrobacter sp. AOP22-C1-22]|uniref:chemotaxis protein CheB n=1 Tax=unclassified Psychrobacter TaxID=196806 RepID=UPI001787CE4F|nr:MULTISPECIES: chemotaxis protein CheB [unclassified Psychrobacter]MBE0406999.1 chemotaxis protein CheB [Psychrobacter sp. FME6]MBE0445372.1 chemotaxis protein CheB [Psychrobacter sp. FME5]MDN5801035.1 chemotaxis protein CheB [Psychrobacter sp.]